MGNMGGIFSSGKSELLEKPVVAPAATNVLQHYPRIEEIINDPKTSYDVKKDRLQEIINTSSSIEEKTNAQEKFNSIKNGGSRKKKIKRVKRNKTNKYKTNKYKKNKY